MILPENPLSKRNNHTTCPLIVVDSDFYLFKYSSFTIFPFLMTFLSHLVWKLIAVQHFPSMLKAVTLQGLHLKHAKQLFARRDGEKCFLKCHLWALFISCICFGNSNCLISILWARENGFMHTRANCPQSRLKVLHLKYWLYFATSTL